MRLGKQKSRVATTYLQNVSHPSLSIFFLLEARGAGTRALFPCSLIQQGIHFTKLAVGLN